MAISLFLKIEGIKGESKDSKHKDEIDIDSFGWGAAQVGTMATGGGGGTGKVSFQDLHCSAHVDRAYPTMLVKCATGEHIKSGVITGRKAGGKDTLEYFKITLSDLLVTQVSVSGSEGSQVMVQYAFQASKVESSYKEQQADGTGGPEVKFGFDLKLNKQV